MARSMTAPARDTVAAYLADAWPGRVSRFSSAPELRVIGPSTPREREIVAGVVEAINLSLPLGMRIRISPPDQGYSLRDRVRSDGRFYGGHPMPGVINVEFLDCTDYVKCGRAAATTWASGGSGGVERAGYVQFSRGTHAHGNDERVRILMAHELLHAVSVDHHVGPQFHSIMTARDHYAHATATILTPLDREAINALYRQLEPGDRPTVFGPWQSTSLHLVGEARHVDFGVALRNGYTEPWAHGARPVSTLGNNRALSGTVTWRGALLGFSGRQPVDGDAAIGVQLGTLTGTAGFTGLEYREGGTTWGDGDLAYAIAVTGNTFHETGRRRGLDLRHLHRPRP